MVKFLIAACLLIAGGLQALTFAPEPLPPVWLGLVNIMTSSFLIAMIWRAPTLRAAVWRAWWFGLSCFSIGLYWLTISMHVYGHMPLPLAIAALLALCAYLALYPAAAAWLAYRHQPSDGQNLQAAFVWAAAWTLAEWLRSYIFTGFPWLNTAYAQVDTWLGAWASIVGAYGVSFLAALFSALLTQAIVTPKQTAPESRRPKVKTAILVFFIICSGWAIKQLEWTIPNGQPIRARLVQGGIDQNSKFTPGQLLEGIRQHLRLAEASPNDDPINIVLLPETAIPVFQHQVPPQVWNAWRHLAVTQGSIILTGAPLFDQTTQRYTNSVIAIDSQTSLQALTDGKLAQRYDKHHLVPFGEFIPWGFRWFVDLMAIPLGDFDRGDTRQASFKVGDQLVAPNICYEDIFGRELLAGLVGDQASSNATILANFSNLGWFGDTWALRQHWQMARMRAIETSRPMLRATNTGITGAIDHRGHPIAMLAPMSPGYLDVSVQGQTGLTPYAQSGDALTMLLCVGILLGARFQRRKQGLEAR